MAACYCLASLSVKWIITETQHIIYALATFGFVINRNPAIRSVGQNPEKNTDLTISYLTFDDNHDVHQRRHVLKLVLRIGLLAGLCAVVPHVVAPRKHLPQVKLPQSRNNMLDAEVTAETLKAEDNFLHHVQVAPVLNKEWPQQTLKLVRRGCLVFEQHVWGKAVDDDQPRGRGDLFTLHIQLRQATM